MIYPTGCLRELGPISAAMQYGRRYPESAPPRSVVQPMTPRVQGETPSCVGQLVAACCDVVVGDKCSGIGIWTDARRRDGHLDDPSVGTYVSSAIMSVTKRGVHPERPGEIEDVASHTRLATIEDELEADDNRVAELADHHVLAGTVDEQREQLVAALTLGKGVGWTTGVSEEFFRHPANVVVSSDEVGRPNNGHALRAFAYCAATDSVLLQNWWTLRWAGVRIFDRDYPGCCLVPMSLLVAAAWETWVLDLRRRNNA